MKKFPFHKLIILILFFSFGLVEQSSATPFLYNLPVFNIESEKENVIDLTGYFLIKPEQIKKIEFGITDKKIINEIKFDKESLKIIVSASSKTGLTEIPFQIFTESDSAPLIMLVKSGKSTYPCEFKYSGTKGMTVSVAGDFNGWNKNADVMTENNGEYRIAM
nr:hypothetical protein [bacterium]